jgi:hypothetical protein
MKPQSALRDEQITLNKKVCQGKKYMFLDVYSANSKKILKRILKITKARARSQRGESKKEIKPLVLNITSVFSVVIF